ncbi:hypothetical protein GCM10025859_41880 [Alicyclobacillus fastidiosus]|nr:hypothetical protein GCM10025859_41880 [Alicyclobacillus fastidiosus]
MVVAGAFVFNSEGSLLLHQRTDNGFWGFPGGYMELGETLEDTARREVFEETGLSLGQLKLFQNNFMPLMIYYRVVQYQ